MSDSNTNSNAKDNRGLWGLETGLPTLTAPHAARRQSAPDAHAAEPRSHLQAMRQLRIAAAANRRQDERLEEQRRVEDDRVDDEHHDAVYVRIQWAETTRYEADLYVDPWASENEIFHQLAALPDRARRVLDVVDSDNHLLSVVDLDGDGHIDTYESSAALVADWGSVADRIDDSIAESPSWPALNAALTTAARGGHDIEDTLCHLAGEAPLPVYDPAGELYYRLLNAGAAELTGECNAGAATQPTPRGDEPSSHGAPAYAPRNSAPAV